ncbi:MAG: sortase [Thermoleophilaceae bacterium]|jgi:sortase A|nr:sortase [Thermoleophilaceae bacterium]
MSGWRKGVRAVLHFIASVLITSGVLLLIDAGLTVTWQEPVSAFFAQQDQSRLSNRLDKAARNFQTRDLVPLAELAQGRADFSQPARRWRESLHTGDPVGRISLPTLHRRYVVVQGTDTDSLRNGPGHYPATPLPGEGGTIAIAGHRTTYGAPFHSVDKLKPGQPIVLDMPYAVFTYRVERTQIVPPTALWITRRVKGRERLVLSACHPLYSASKRIVVFARLANARMK